MCRTPTIFLTMSFGPLQTGNSSYSYFLPAIGLHKKMRLHVFETGQKGKDKKGKKRGTIPGAMNKYQKARAALAFLHAMEAREVASIFWCSEACVVVFICPASAFSLIKSYLRQFRDLTTLWWFYPVGQLRNSKQTKNTFPPPTHFHLLLPSSPGKQGMGSAVSP